ncbi:formiminotransferase N-terminal subdomain-containing protein isoform X2 [Pseudoliparis swirei]|uniref:formiminotransferase N-terminal subdomain-containing protein isoform X2 n=1 Tax=Pseudoliparis swirei TaxID=2059687 RepID=UPI0024BED79F|nr:formiminotransferase N-terminal subdomain-containing protein isoform X2 [Pseudoliparis swirei]
MQIAYVENNNSQKLLKNNKNNSAIKRLIISTIVQTTLLAQRNISRPTEEEKATVSSQEGTILHVFSPLWLHVLSSTCVCVSGLGVPKLKRSVAVFTQNQCAQCRKIIESSGRNMASGSVGRRLVACLLNVSEARRKDLVETVAKAALYDEEGVTREGTAVLNIFNDQDYNRSVITIVASVDSIGEAVLSACEKACALIDMAAHKGVHPCMGAVDLIPIYPLGEEVGVEDCAQEARAVARGLTERVPGTSAFLFGWADSPRQRGLAQRRKEMGWFKETPDLRTIRPDVGPPPRNPFGLTGVGASPYVTNCNVTIDTRDMAVGRSIAAALRESTPGGLPGVQVLALPHDGAVEIACNVESVRWSPAGPKTTAGEPWPRFSVAGQPYCHVPASLITARVAELAGREGVGVKGTALVGFTPRECRGLAEFALSRRIAEFWKERAAIRM